MPELRLVIRYLKQFDEVLAQLRAAMKHAHPYSVDRLRHTVAELEAIRHTILTSELQSGRNLEALLQKARDCIRECIRPPYTGKPQVLPRPIPEEWQPPVTVTGVNIIFVVDISASMFQPGGGMETRGRVRRLLISMAREIKRYADEAMIPTRVSTVYYADPTHSSNRNRFTLISLNKEENLDKLERDFETVNRSQFAKGADCPESGLTAIYRTINQVFDDEIINNKPVENSLILVSDDVQKLDNRSGGALSSCPGSHANFKEVTYSDLRSRLDGLNLFNLYALVPRNIGANGRNGGPAACGSSRGRTITNYGHCYLGMFRQHKEYFAVNDLSDIYDWVLWTLDPTSAPHNIED